MKLAGCVSYETFLESKTHSENLYGFKSARLPAAMIDFQSALTEWALRKGRAAVLADCGLGKTLIQLAWADNVVRETNRPVLILTPLAVSSQTEREGEKFGIECHRSSDGKVRPGINITNYERLHYFNPSDFAGVVCDESSILKSFDGVRRNQITDFMRKTPYRLLCTATAAPNDYVELGTSSEALGELGHMDMLNRFFKNENNTSDTKGHWRGHAAPRAFEGQKWRFKGHAELPFWRWVCSWARSVRKPSDLGFEDGAFILPELIETNHFVDARRLAPGQLFAMSAVGLAEQREERRRTIQERCEKLAAMAGGKDQCLVWGSLNDECDLLENMIDGAVQVSGADSDEEKEEKFLGFVNGQIRALVSKAKIVGWGLNFQNCHRLLGFPSHSFEQYYQIVRRCWRFGQKHPVTVDIVLSEGEREVLASLQRKAKAADIMFGRLVQQMQFASRIDKTSFETKQEIPSWLS